MNQQASQLYRERSLAAASPARLVALLYDRAINLLREAVRAIEDGDIEGRWRANGRAIEIINHLDMTLDLERGGEIAANLERLYRFMLNRLTKVDLQNDPQAALDVIELLKPMRQSWHELADQGVAASNEPAETNPVSELDEPEMSERLSLSA